MLEDYLVVSVPLLDQCLLNLIDLIRPDRFEKAETAQVLDLSHELLLFDLAD